MGKRGRREVKEGGEGVIGRERGMGVESGMGDGVREGRRGRKRGKRDLKMADSIYGG